MYNAYSGHMTSLSGHMISLLLLENYVNGQFLVEIMMALIEGGQIFFGVRSKWGGG